MPKLKNILFLDIPRLKKDEERLFWILHKIKKILLFSISSNLARRVNFLHLCFYLLLYFFLAAWAAANSLKRICTSGWFVRMEKNNCTPDTNDYVWEHFKNIWGWILKRWRKSGPPNSQSERTKYLCLAIKVINKPGHL